MKLYRLEVRENGRAWNGVYSVLDPDECTYASRGLHVPVCIRRGAYDTRSWFTVKGWKKYSGRLFKVLTQYKQRWDKNKVDYRILVMDSSDLPGKIISRGTIQAVEDLTGIDIAA